MSARRRNTKTIVIVVALLIAVLGYGCSNRRGPANAVGEAVRGLPGVSAAEVRYNRYLTSGAHFDLEVTLADTASADQAAAVGRTFVDRMRHAYFPDFEVTLVVFYKHSSDIESAAPGSRADFTYNFDMTARGGPASGEVADNLAFWLQIAQSPGVEGVSLHQPSWSGPVSSRDVSIYLAPSVTDAAITDITHAHPDVSTAAWVLRAPPVIRFRQSREYRIRGPFPGQQRRDLWHRIVDMVGDGDVSASTITVNPRAGVPPTSVEITVDYFGPHDSRPFEDFARAITPLLLGLGAPIAYRLFGSGQHVEFTIGGCRPPDSRYPPSALEHELRQQYGSC